VLTTDQKGAIAESAIVHAATKLGVDVYKPLADGGRYDLIFDLGTKLLRVQYKWAKRSGGAVVVRCYSCRRNSNGMLVRRYTPDEVDAIAAYCPDTGGCYLVPPDLFDGRRCIYLRVAPSRNNQRMRINRAEEFGLGARLTALAGP
jgi:hypothetical protein